MVKVQAGLLLNQNRGNSASWQRTRVASGKWHVAGGRVQVRFTRLVERSAGCIPHASQQKEGERGSRRKHRVQSTAPL